MKSLLLATLTAVFLIIVVFSFYQKTTVVTSINEKLVKKLSMRIEADQLSTLFDDFYTCQLSLAGETISTTVDDITVLVPKSPKSGVWTAMVTDYTINATTDFHLDNDTYVASLTAKLDGKEWPLSRLVLRLNAAKKIVSCQSYNIKNLLIPTPPGPPCSGPPKFLTEIRPNGSSSCDSFP